MIDLVMKRIGDFRKVYTSNFSFRFKNSKEKQLYIKDWVANYEISDYLQ